MITTLGNILINEALPSDLHIHDKVIDKKELNNILSNVANKHPKQYSTIVKKIKDIGDLHAYFSGSSFKFDDFKPISVDHIYKKYDNDYKKVNAITDDKKRNDELRKINVQIENEINNKISNDMKNPNSVTSWVASGAKGSKDNIRKMFYSVGNQVNIKKELEPHMAKSCLSDGLSPSDYFIMAKGTRKGVANSFMSVRDPGAFAKEMSQMTNDFNITSYDCFTSEGQVYNIGSKDALDCCLAEPVLHYPKNEVYTTTIAEELKHHNIKTVKVRTPRHCKAHHGVCQKCYGLTQDGIFPHLGDTVGIRASQSVTEILTQSSLKEKHTGGAMNNKSLFELVKLMLHVPESFPGAAVLSRNSGVVSKIEVTPDKGRKVFIGDQVHYALPTQGLFIKKGDHVKKGDQLSEGIINPAELVSLKGMDEGRAYLSKALQDIYHENGTVGHAKIFDTISKSVLSLGQVESIGDHHEFLPGEYLKWDSHKHLMEKTPVKQNPLDSTGFRLNNDLHMLGLKKDTYINPDIASQIHGHGIKEIEVYKNPMVINPVMLGTERAALIKNDWLATLGFRHVKNTLLDNVARAKGAKIHSWNPNTSYYIGNEFGKGDNGQF